MIFPTHTHTHPGINTLAYVLCCLPAAVSQLAKEQAIIEFAQPINFYYLNLLLGIYQFVLLLVLSPLTYRLQVGREGGMEGEGTEPVRKSRLVLPRHVCADLEPGLFHPISKPLPLSVNWEAEAFSLMLPIVSHSLWTGRQPLIPSRLPPIPGAGNGLGPVRGY